MISDANAQNPSVVHVRVHLDSAYSAKTHLLYTLDTYWER